MKLQAETVVVVKWDGVYLDSLIEEGYEIIPIIDDFDEEIYIPWLQRNSSKIPFACRVPSVDSIDAICAVSTQIAQSLIPIKAVISTSEFSQFAAGLLKERLHCEGPSLDLVVRSRDKRAMKDLMLKHSIPCAKFLSFADKDSLLEESEQIAELGYPVIVKSPTGMGTKSTVLVQSESELSQMIKDFSFDDSLLCKSFMVEQYIEGEEYYIDAVWEEHEPVAFLISKYLIPRIKIKLDEHNNGAITLDRDKHSGLYEEVLKFHRRVNHAFGISRGVTHLEIFGSPTGVLYFSEIATRVGGGSAADVFKVKYGQSIQSLLVRQLKGAKLEALADNRPGVVGWINLSPKQSGIVKSIPDCEVLSRMPGILYLESCLSVGDHFDASHPSSWSLLLVLEAENEQEFLFKKDQLFSEFLYELQ
jgi:biotin carboxylase